MKTDKVLPLIALIANRYLSLCLAFDWFPSCRSSDRRRFASEPLASLKFSAICRFYVLAGEISGDSVDWSGFIVLSEVMFIVDEFEKIEKGN